MVQADSATIIIIEIVLHDATVLAQNQWSFGWAAQVSRCFDEHGKYSPLMGGAPAAVWPDELVLTPNAAAVHL